jgi:hypothetical protein
MLPEGPRQPLHARLTGTPADRRLNRLEPPACEFCGRDDVRVTLRTEYVLYFRCQSCLGVWSVAKPDRLQFGT